MVKTSNRTTDGQRTDKNGMDQSQVRHNPTIRKVARPDCRAKPISQFTFPLLLWLTMVRSTGSGRDLPKWSESNYGRAAYAPGANGQKQNKRTKNRRITRGDESKCPRLAIESSVDVPPTPSLIHVCLTRSQPIWCTHYGPDRHAVFWSHLLCGPCKEWESLMNTGTDARNKLQ